MFRSLRVPTILALAWIPALPGCGGGGGAGSSSSAPGAPSGLTYGQAVFALLLGAPIEALVPTVQGSVTSWSLAPAGLPPGLAFDPGTGVISGAPTDLAATVRYTVTAENGQGKDTVSFDLRVAKPTNYAYAAGPDGTLTVFSVDAVDGRLFHRGFAVDPAALPVAEAPTVHPENRHLYVPNLGDSITPSNISIYEVRDDGSLVTEAPVPVGVGPHRMALRDDGLTAYATCFGSDELFAYRVSGAAGLVPFASGPVPVGDGPLAVAVDASRRFVYVANLNDTTISSVPLDLVTGEPLGPGQTFFMNGGVVTGIGVGPERRFLFVTLENFDLLLAMVVDEVTGKLTVVDAVATGPEPAALAVGPTGEQVLVCNGGGGGTVSAYVVDAVTGALTPGATLVPIGADPVAISIDDAGRHAYVACRGLHEVVSLDLADPLAPAVTVRVRSRPSPLGLGLFDGGRPARPRARALYAVNGLDATVSVYATDPVDGGLSEVGPPVLVGVQPADLAVDPFGRFAFVAERGTDSVRTFQIDQTTWDLVSQGLPQAVAADPAGIAVDPAGRFLVVTSASTDLVASYAIDGVSGALTAVDQASTGAEPGPVAIDPTGQFVITGNQAGEDLSAFRLATDGTFAGTLIGDVAPGSPSGLHFSPDGSRLYVALTGADHVVPYTIHPLTGELSLQPPGAQANDEPRALLPSPVAARAYAPLAGPGTGALAVFTLDGDGNPSLHQTLDNVGLTPVDVAIDPAGRFLYAANLDGDDLGRYLLDGQGDAAFVQLVPAGDGPLALALLRRVE